MPFHGRGVEAAPTSRRGGAQVTLSDVLIVGGGPAGSSCAWKLTRAGVAVTVIDRAVFPRDKVCAGWITPQVVHELALDVDDYQRDRTFQPIHGFRTGLIGRTQAVETTYDRPISFGIRRCEFDEYLLARSGAEIASGEPARDIRRQAGLWTVNGRYAAPILIGAGGHFCPVARQLNRLSEGGHVVAAQEAEFPLPSDRDRARRFRTDAERPELYFSQDFRGYGWIFRKGRVLNVGFGSLERRRLPSATAAFTGFLKLQGRIPDPHAFAWRGHAYRLYESGPRRVVGDGVLLVGDAAGLAYPESGEGIRPAIESGLLAAAAILESGGQLEPYERALRTRFRTGGRESRGLPIPPGLTAVLGRGLIRLPWFVRRVVLDRWFLHASDPALAC
jgi:flavin-dependent dehydrogenase